VTSLVAGQLEAVPPPARDRCLGPSCDDELPDGRSYFCSNRCLDEWAATNGNTGKHKHRRGSARTDS
jgi:hypothetical protein